MPTCPKCGFALAGGEMECPACGVILAKVRSVPPLLPSAAEAVPPPVPPQPPPREAASPYAPPAAPMTASETLYSGAPAPLAGGGGEISPQTLQALTAMRPWLGFLVGYGIVMLTLMAFGAVVSLLVAGRNPKVLPLAVVYGFYSVIGFAFLLPLRRSAQAIRRLSERGPRATVEGFVVEQGVFWRRSGILTAVMVAILVIGFVLAVVLGGAAVLKQLQGS